MNVEHLMTKNPVTCEIDSRCEEVARQMRDKNVGSVIVLENGRVAGIVTDRQLAVNCLAEGHDGDTTVGHVMTENPACCTLEDNVFSVVDTFRSAGMVRRLPVVDEDDRLLGVVSIADVAVVANDLVQHILQDEIHHSLNETRLMTGAKRMVKKIRRPTKARRLPRGQPVRATSYATPQGPPPKSGGAGRPQTRRHSNARTTRRGPAKKSRRGGIGQRLRRVLPGRQD